MPNNQTNELISAKKKVKQFAPPEYKTADEEKKDKKTYPLPSFYFKVDCGFVEEYSFQEVTGLTHEMNTTEITQGGENQLSYHLPVTKKYPNLKLKRGIIPQNTGLVNWCKEVLEGDFEKVIEPRDITISLLDITVTSNTTGPACTWICCNAFPVRWEIDTFNASDNKVAIETIELQYTHLKRSL